VSIRERVMWSVVVAMTLVSAALAWAGQRGEKLKPKSVQVDPSSSVEMRVLGGPPETVTMRSGSVVLLPSKSVGKHDTGEYEEAVVVLAGHGEMRLADGTVLALRPYVVAYCPPGTEHDVTNTGTEPLRYIYVVAKAR
jgi:quercetin dioxygenase-like cupin family protein